MLLKGMDYFPLSTDFFEEDKIALIEAEFGEKGLVILLKLFCKIYKNGFYLEWDEDICLLFARKTMNGLLPEAVKQVIGKALERGLFDKKMYERFGILTSVEIQRQFFLVANRRKEVWITEKDFLLIDLSGYKNIRVCEEIVPNDDARNILGENVASLEENVASKQQRKGKEKKEKENITTITTNAGEAKKINIREIFGGYREELLADEDWLASVVRISGKGAGIIQLLPEAMEMFDYHAISIGQTGECLPKRQYAQHFINWWRCMKFRSAAEMEEETRRRNEAVDFRQRNRPAAKSRVQQAIELGNAVAEKLKQMHDYERNYGTAIIRSVG